MFRSLCGLRSSPLKKRRRTLSRSLTLWRLKVPTGSQSFNRPLFIFVASMATSAPLLGKQGKAAHSKASIFYGADEYLEEQLRVSGL